MYIFNVIDSCFSSKYEFICGRGGEGKRYFYTIVMSIFIPINWKLLIDCFNQIIELFWRK